MTDVADDAAVLRRAAELLDALEWGGTADLLREEAARIEAERARAADPVAQVVEALRAWAGVDQEAASRWPIARVRAALAAYDAAQREAGR